MGRTKGSKNGVSTKIKKICDMCGKYFSVIPCHKDSVFCSHKCYWESMKGKSIRNRGNALGKEHPKWKGGLCKHGRGYIKEYAPQHPMQSGNYVSQHRLVMEKHLGRYLLPKEVVHHINGIKDDNRLENLMLFPNHKAHRLFHIQLNPRKPCIKICQWCKKEFSHGDKHQRFCSISCGNKHTFSIKRKTNTD